MRIRPNLVAGVAAAALALTACSVAAGTSGGTHTDHAAPVSADSRFTELKDLAEVKRDTSWRAAGLAGARQPQTDTRFTEMRELAKAKQEASWKAAELAWGR